ncbi:RloB family protein [Neolewinella agarilytica]|uniref:RloB-like protein n=1 Tax=Neolewinella agarilytica TaxID=478744 RepID=A0A1H9KF35_9BACT|nr:RloB family protein [Neolewinella agarilytica]SEQ97679.1 RloB-like protein [Neolewinella agarilytica]
MARQKKKHRKAIQRGKRFLIFCEGQTERLYFKSFHDKGVSVEPRDPNGDRKQLVKDAINSDDGSYDQIWVVFDLDYLPAKGNAQLTEFDATISKARAAGIRVAYSVDAFELWFCLHYAYVNTRQERAYYYQQLSKRWSINYEREGKKAKFCLGIRALLENDEAASEEEAIKRAKKLLATHSEEPPHRQNPVTTVFELVEELLSSKQG